MPSAARRRPVSCRRRCPRTVARRWRLAASLPRRLREASFADKEAFVDALEPERPCERPARPRRVCSKIVSTFAPADQKVFIVKSADEARTTLDLVDPLTLARRSARRERPSKRSAPTTACGRRCESPSRASICRAPTRRCGSPPSRRCCGRSTRRASRAPAARRHGNATPASKRRSRPASRSARSTAPIAKARLAAVQTLAHRLRPGGAQPARGASREIVRTGRTSESDTAVRDGRRACGLADR